MAQTAVGTLIAPATNGQTVKATLGWRPTLVFVLATGAPSQADAAAYAGHGIALGWAADGFGSRTRLICGTEANGEGGALNTNLLSQGSVIGTTYTNELTMSIVFDADGFTLTRQSGATAATAHLAYLAVQGPTGRAFGSWPFILPGDGTAVASSVWPRPPSTVFGLNGLYVSTSGTSGTNGVTLWEPEMVGRAEKRFSLGIATLPANNLYRRALMTTALGVKPSNQYTGTTVHRWIPQNFKWTGVELIRDATWSVDEQGALDAICIDGFSGVAMATVPTVANNTLDLTASLPMVVKGAIIIATGYGASGTVDDTGASICVAYVDSAGTVRNVISGATYSAGKHQRSRLATSNIVSARIDTTTGALSSIMRFNSFITNGIRLQADGTSPPAAGYNIAALLLGEQPTGNQTEYAVEWNEYKENLAAHVFSPVTDVPPMDIWEQPVPRSQLFSQASKLIGWIHGATFYEPHIYGFSRDTDPNTQGAGYYTIVRAHKDDFTTYEVVNVPAPSGGGRILHRFSACAIARGKIWTVGRDPLNDHAVIVEVNPAAATLATACTVRADLPIVLTGQAGGPLAECVVANESYLWFTHGANVVRVNLDTWAYTSAAGSVEGGAYHCAGLSGNDLILTTQVASSGVNAYLCHLNATTLAVTRQILFPANTDDATITGDYFVGSPESSRTYATSCLPWGKNMGLAAYRISDGKTFYLGSFDQAFDDQIYAAEVADGREGLIPHQSAGVISYGVWNHGGWLVDFKLNPSGAPTFRRLYVVRLDAALISKWTEGPVQDFGHAWAGTIPANPFRDKLVRRSAYFQSYPGGHGAANEFVSDGSGNFYAFTWSATAGLLYIPGLLPVDLYETTGDIWTFEDGMQEYTGASDEFSYTDAVVETWGWVESAQDTILLTDGTDELVSIPFKGPIVILKWRFYRNDNGPIRIKTSQGVVGMSLTTPEGDNTVKVRLLDGIAGTKPIE